MNEHDRPGDPVFDRLVAADPAKHAPEPVQGVLRAKVDALIAGQAEQEPVASESGSTRHEEAEPAGSGQPAGRARTDELALRRYRRRTPWLVAAAVAGIVAAGGGGYVAGESGLEVRSTADSGAESGEAAPSVMGQPVEPEGATDSGDSPAAENEAAAGGVEPLDASGDLPTATGLVFHAGAALSDTPTTAQVRVAGAAGTSLGSYPVVSEVEAVERLGDPRFAGAVLGWTRQDQAQEETAPPARTTPAPGGPVAWPVKDVTIVSATLTEARYTLPDDTVLLVPAYDLTDDEGSRWTVMAVDEEHLDFVP